MQYLTQLIVPMEQVQSADNPAPLQAMAARAQAFVHRYLGHYGKALYTQQALLRYNALFSDMSQFMAQHVADKDLESLHWDQLMALLEGAQDGATG